MHSGFETTPEGWAVCDGNTYDYFGERITTPDLRGRFIKAVESKTLVGESSDLDVDSENKIQLKKEHLPKHSHPHVSHNHNIEGLSVNIDNSGNLEMNFSSNNYVYEVSENSIDVVTDVVMEGSEISTVGVVRSVSTSEQGGSVIGGNHSHSASISGGNITESTSREDEEQIWENEAFNVEPNYYSLIFIMKL